MDYQSIEGCDVWNRDWTPSDLIALQSYRRATSPQYREVMLAALCESYMMEAERDRYLRTRY